MVYAYTTFNKLVEILNDLKTRDWVRYNDIPFYLQPDFEAFMFNKTYSTDKLNQKMVTKATFNDYYNRIMNESGLTYAIKFEEA